MEVTFVLTHDCNLGCSYCYAGRKFRKAMSRDIRDRALALAFLDVSEGQLLRLCYFGGEPTLEWDLLVETALKARELADAKGVALEQSMTTNGTLLTKARVATLAELGVYIALSIDGNREAHDAERPHMSGKSSFDDVHSGLSCVLQAGLAFETISVVTPSNAHLIGKSVAYLFDLGVPRVSLNVAYEAAWNDASLESLKQGLVDAAQTTAAHFRQGRIVSFSLFDAKIALRNGKKAACAIGEGAVAIAPSGNIYPCERMVAEDENAAYVIGHVNSGISLLPMRSHRDALPKRAYASGAEAEHHAVNDDCGDCGERERCSASCACANLAETGNIGVAGGVQCLFERSLLEITDAWFDTMVAEKNASFAEWFSIDYKTLKPRAARSRVSAIAQQGPQEANRRLPVVRNV
jgi:uncharacterized protein